MQSELVSVLMPVRNGLPHVREAVQSILRQDYRNIQFIIVNDGSIDGTADYLSSVSDSRLLVVNSTGNGLVTALNQGLDLCQGRYTARMDADDISAPGRISTQMRAAFSDDAIGVISSDIERISSLSQSLGVERGGNLSPSDLRNSMLFESKYKPIVHPTVLFKTDLVRLAGGYRHYDASEDRDLWLRLVDRTRFVRLSEVLLQYRMTPTGVSRSKRVQQTAGSIMAALNYQINDRHAIDIYEEYPELWRSLLRLVTRDVEAIFPAERAFEEAKQTFRRGRYVGAMAQVMHGVVQHRLAFIPAMRRRMLRAHLRARLALAGNLIAAVQAAGPVARSNIGLSGHSIE